MNIELFFVPLTALDAELCRRSLALLSPDERAKVERYRSAKAQANGLLVRAALRCVLTQVTSQNRHYASALDSSAMYSDFAPQSWHFEYGQQGKPRLCSEQYSQTGLEFNLSHSGDWLLIAVASDFDSASEALATQTQVTDSQPHDEDASRTLLLGVDIERARANTDIYPILKRYFSSIETEALLALEDKVQRQRFFDLWALKESYIKATGLGLAQSLESFAFLLAPNSLVGETAEQLSSTFELLALERFGACAENGIGGEAECAPTQLGVYSDIQVVSEPKTKVNDWHWQSYFGRINEEYRFGMSLAHPQILDKVPISIKLATLSQLLDACAVN